MGKALMSVGKVETMEPSLFGFRTAWASRAVGHQKGSSGELFWGRLGQMD